MIILKIRGGIGNQLFPYALGRILALKYNTNLILDTTWYRGADRKFVLDELNTIYCKVKISNRFILPIINFLLKSRVIKDTDSFEKIEMNPKENIFLCGDWGSYPKYFNDEEKILLGKELAPKNPSASFLKYSQEIDKNNSIAIHIRRGDFLRPKDPHIVLDKSYYVNAAADIISNQKLPDPQIIIFSDDPTWCKENIKINNLKINVFQDPEVSDLEQLFLISFYKYMIMSNSGFSWWAAFLNGNPNKIIITPQIWQKDPLRNERFMKDSILPTWKIQ